MAAVVVVWKRRHHQNSRNKNAVNLISNGELVLTMNANFEPQQPMAQQLISPAWGDATVPTRTTAPDVRRPRPQTVFRDGPDSMDDYDTIDDYDTYDPPAAESQRPTSATVYVKTVSADSEPQVSNTNDIDSRSRAVVKLDSSNYVSV